MTTDLARACKTCEVALVMGQPSLAREALPALIAALSAAGYTIPTPPAAPVSPAPGTLKTAPAFKAATAPKAVGTEGGCRGGTAAHGAAKGGTVAKAGVIRKPLATIPSRAATAAKPGGRADKGGAAKGFATSGVTPSPPPSSVPQGGLHETAVCIQPAHAGVPVLLTLSFIPGMTVGPGESVWVKLPGFSGTDVDIGAWASRLTATWDVGTHTLTLRVHQESHSVLLGRDADASLLVAGLSSPPEGVSASHGMIISSDAKAGAMSGVPIQRVSEVKGCRFSGEVQRGILVLGRTLLLGGARAREDYECVAYLCFLDVFKDSDDVECKAATRMLAAVCCELTLRSQPFVLVRVMAGEKGKGDENTEESVTTKRLSSLIRTIEQSRLLLAEEDAIPRSSASTDGDADGWGTGGGTSARAVASVVNAEGLVAGRGDSERERDVVKTWVRDLAKGIGWWEANECKAVADNVSSTGPDRKKPVWRDLLCSMDRMVMMERSLATDDQVGALKELHALVHGLDATEGSTFARVMEARVQENAYLQCLNTKPDLSALETALQLMADAWSAAASAAEHGRGNEAQRRAAVCWLHQGQALEEVKHVSMVYAVAGKAGKSAGQDPEARDAANMDEVRGLLKQRGVSPGAPVEEIIQEIEDEHADNVRFGLTHEADMVAALLEWYRDYRTRLQRGGDMYATKQDAAPDEEDPQVKAALVAAKHCYEKSVKVLSDVEEGAYVEVLAGALAGLGRVDFFLRDWGNAVETLSKAALCREYRVEAGLYAGLAKLAQAEARGLPPASSDLLSSMAGAYAVVGAVAGRLREGDHSVVEHYHLLCADAIRVDNPLLLQGGVRLGEALLREGRSNDSVTILRHAVAGLQGMGATGVCRAAKAEARTWECRGRSRLVQVLSECDDSMGAIEQALRVEEALASAAKGDAGALDARLDNIQRALRVAPSWAELHAAEGHILWATHEHHPKRRREPALLDAAEASFRRALSLEGAEKASLHRSQSPGRLVSARPGHAREGCVQARPGAGSPGWSSGNRSKGGDRNRGGGTSKRRELAKCSMSSLKAGVVRGGAVEGGEKDREAKGAATTVMMEAAPQQSRRTNCKIASVRIGLARIMQERLQVLDVLNLSDGDCDALVALYEEAISIDRRDVEAYYKVGELLQMKRPQKAAELYAKYPVNFEKPNQDDAFIAGEVVRLSLRGKDYLKWAKGGPEVVNVGRGLVIMAKVNTLDTISTYVEKLEEANQTAILCEVFAAVNNRALDDKEMLTYFHCKGWMVGGKTPKLSMENMRLMHPLL